MKTAELFVEAFDCYGVRVDDSGDLKEALAEAFQADRPAVISIPIDYWENTILSGKLGAIEYAI